jgi:hypothetical protein
VACAVVEGLSRTLAAELGRHRIGETLVDADFPVPRDKFIGFLKGMTLTKNLPALADVAITAVLLASDHAAAISGAVANLTGRMSVD